MPAVRLAETLAMRGQAIYNYLFTWPSPLMDGRLGACHAIEQSFEFGFLDDHFSGAGPEAEALSEKMQDAWIAFARTGDPSCDSLGPWPTYGADRETMILGPTCQIQNAPHEQERQLWDDVSDTAIGAF